MFSSPSYRMTTPFYWNRFYFFSIFIFLERCNPLLIWVFMELNLLALLVLCLNIDLYGEIKEFGLYYFLIQSLGRLLFLWGNGVRIYIREFLDSIVFSFAIILKVGIFPLFFWILKLGSSLRSYFLVLILSLQKVPMFFLLFQRNFSFILFLLLFSFFFGRIFIFFFKDFKLILVSSSISTSFWIFWFFSHRVWIFLTFNILYFMTLYFLVRKIEDNFNVDWLKMCLFVFLSGLPPFSLFFFKFFLFSLIFELHVSLLFILWVVRFFRLVGYLKFFYFNFFSYNFFYLHNKFLFTNISFFYLRIFIFFPFLLNYRSKLFKLLSSYLK